MKNKREDRATRAEVRRSERTTSRGAKATNNASTGVAKNIMWIVGVLVALTGLFLLASSVASLFCWRADYAVLHGETSGVVTNPFGPVGARIGELFVGLSFGLFGVLIPVVVSIIGVAMIRCTGRHLNHAALSMVLVMVVGSLTLGLAFDTQWDMFGSGWGGALGIELAKMLYQHIGAGAWFVVIVAWILTGVFINIKFIGFLNRKGEQVVGQGRRVVELTGALLASAASRGGAAAEDGDGEIESTPESTDSRQLVDESVTPAEEPTPESEPTVEPIAEPAVEPVIEPEVVAAPAEVTPAAGVAIINVEEHTEALVSKKEANHRAYDPDSTPNYKFPKVDFLVDYASDANVSDDEILSNKRKIEETLGNFGIPIREMKATIGPTVTLYEIVQEAGVRIARVQGLESDIAQSLKALGIRIIAPMPGRGTIGIEVPNRSKETVSMRSAIQSERFQNFKAELPVVIGRTIQNENYVFDLAKMPHLLVAGATGQGKSVGLNAIIASLLYRKDPSQLKFVLVDPKTVEFTLYKKLENHFMAKMESEDEAIVTDPKKAVYTLNSLCIEMENRLAKCGKAGVRNIVEYNDMVRKRKVEDDIMPYIVVVIDEFADLIMTAKEVEQPVMRLAQKARAIGIHLIVATQRPDVKVITGGIKANFPARIAFRVMQMIDSRTIIDQPGANQLIGRGDMLFSNGGELTRIQCAFVDTPEVRDIVDYIASQPYPYPSGTYLLPDFSDGTGGGDTGDASSDMGSAPIKYDALFADIAREAVSSGSISVSYIQRNYEVGFNRAGRIMTQLERAGIVGPQVGAAKRDIKFYDMPSLEARLQELGVA